jgi:hypothetical protein
VREAFVDDLSICLSRINLDKSKSESSVFSDKQNDSGDIDSDNLDSEPEIVADLSGDISVNLADNLDNADISNNSASDSDSESDTSESETEMAAGMNPPLFRGLFSENAQQFWNYANLWMSTKRHVDEHTKIKQLAIFLRDRAANWFQGITLVASPNDGAELAPNTCDTFARFGEIFVAKFRVPENENWREVANLYTCRQGPQETTEEYCGRLQREADTARADEKQVIQAAIAGLRTDIQRFVLTQNITSIEDIIRWGAPVSASPKLTLHQKSQK